MESVPNMSSEEDLLGLRNEGKISEAEYQDLLGAMKKSLSSGTDAAVPQSNNAGSKRKLGKIAFALMLAGIVLPFLVDHGLLGVAFQIVALALGVISWPDVYGKVTVVSATAIVVLLLLLTT